MILIFNYHSNTLRTLLYFDDNYMPLDLMECYTISGNMGYYSNIYLSGFRYKMFEIGLWASGSTWAIIRPPLYHKNI